MQVVGGMTHPPNRLVAVLIAGALMLAMSACGGDDDRTSAASSAVTPTSPSPAPAPTSSASCAPSAAGVPVSVPGSGGRYTLTVSAGALCAWTIQSDAAWASVTPVSGQGNGTTLLTVEENPAVGNTRSANLTLGSQVMHFSQANACTYTLDQTTGEVGSDGGTFTLHLSTRDGCAWTASATEKWIRPAETSGSGSVFLKVDVDPNAGGDRHATLTIAGQRLVVTQRGR